jgi:WD40 repeat protein
MQRTRLLDFMHFIEQNMTLFSKHPLLLLQSAANGPDASYVTRSALKLVDDQMTTFGWFKFLNKSNSSDPCVLTIGSAGAAVACCFTPDSKKLALSCIDGFGGRATVYDAYTGAALNSHTLSANPKAMTYNSDGRVMMVMNNDGCCTIYDTVNNKERIRGFISTTDLTCAALSLDGTKVMRSLADNIFDK